MSIKVTSYVWEHSKQRGTKLLMLLAIADNANDQGEAHPKLDTLARKTKMTKRNAQMVIQKLESERDLVVQERENTSNLYIIPVPWRADAPQRKRKPHPLRGVKKPSSVRDEDNFIATDEETFIPTHEETFISGVKPDSSEGVKVPSHELTTTEPSVELNTTTTTEPDVVVVVEEPESLLVEIPDEDPPEPPAETADDVPGHDADAARVFTWYENNIGLITSAIADAIKLALTEVPADWIVDAITLATKKEKRSWAYADGVLKNWKRDGRGAEKPNSNGGQAPTRHKPTVARAPGTPDFLTELADGTHDDDLPRMMPRKG